MYDLVPIILMALLAGGIVASFILASIFLGPKKRTQIKDEPFECGIPSNGMGHVPVPVRFYVMAMLFIVFDVELAFLFPWAVVFRRFGISGLVEMLVFFLVVGVGFVYAWKSGALEWD